MPDVTNILLLAVDALVYFVALAGLLRARTRIGLGAFFCALGVMHFLETYLASIVYVPLPFGIVTSPGSTVLFTGKLMMLLLLYIREDAVVVRQPIYGLLFGNVLLFALAFVMRQHTMLFVPGRAADFVFLNEMGALMVWGTAILFFDCILIILLYERTRSWFGDRVFPRLLLSSALVLTFDQAAFFAGLHMLTGAGVSVLIGGWIAKMGAVAFYSVLATVYLVYLERPIGRRDAPRIWDIFDTLTYRERYEDLLARTGCDALTGALDRHSLEAHGRRSVEHAAAAGRPLALLLIDIDHFKAFNDRFGHAAGDKMLKRIALDIMAAARVSDFTYRFGGEEFVIIAEGLSVDEALSLGERVRRRVLNASPADPEAKVTVSIGVATCSRDATEYDALFEIADKRLYQAKAAGRNRVIGERPPPGEKPWLVAG
ncbi:MAG TPA: GGDEF domain-containing protein [Pseudolabrys sp.]|nr:GGDEF domain-containing protein [Pseudolabrys sp.]